MKIDISNYTTKTEKKKKKNLASLKTEVDKFEIDKLVSALLDLSKLSDVVKMMLLKKLLLIN